MTKSELMVKVSSVAGYEQDPADLIKFAEEMWKLAFVELTPVEQAYVWNKISTLIKEGEYEKVASFLTGMNKRVGGIISKYMGKGTSAMRPTYKPMNPTTLHPEEIKKWKSSHRALRASDPKKVI